MFPEYEKRIAAEAVEAYPKEAVWLITSEGCRLVDNVSEDPYAAFRVSDVDMLRAQKEGLEAVVHSHPEGPACPSEADMRGQLETAVPWGVVACNAQESDRVVWWGPGVAIPPLVGRGFRHGVTDCYALIRDYFRLEQGIELPEFPRNWGWWHQGQNLYLEGFPKAGFRRVYPEEEPLQAGDMWFSQIRSKVPNHGGIYLGDETTIHHTASRDPVERSRLSKREPIHRWMPHITHWLRHEELDK